jgi:hypothetical protein
MGNGHGNSPARFGNRIINSCVKNGQTDGNDSQCPVGSSYMCGSFGCPNEPYI